MSLSIDIDGRIFPVEVRHHARARRMILRLHPKKDGVVVTLPKGMEARDALKMAEKNKVWIANQLARNGQKMPIKDGVDIPFRGSLHTVRYQKSGPRRVRLEGEQIIAGGEEAFLHRRIVEWMKKQARAEMTPLAHDLAAKLGKKVHRLSVRDTRSRWGSCSSQGNLSLNWRLIMAPSEVLTYVVAHEVAHLEHMDHSQHFWETVDRLVPNARKQRDWLKRHGKMLHQFQEH